MLNINRLHISIHDQPIVSDVSLSLAPGTVHVLMGPNGSGKSSLACALMGQPAYSITAGTIVLDGHDITQAPADQRAKKGLFLAYQQPPSIPGLSVRTLLYEAHAAITGSPMPSKEFQEYLEHYRAMVRLDASFLSRALNEGCSGGEKKKLELLQLLVLKPTVAILDEIDAGLDVDALALIAQVITSLASHNPRFTVLLITHNPRVVHTIIPHAVHVMHTGSLRLSGTQELAHEIENKGYDGIGI